LRQDSHWTAKYIPPSPPTTAKVVPPHMQGGIFHGSGFVDFEPSFLRPRFRVRFPRWAIREPKGPMAFGHFRIWFAGRSASSHVKIPSTSNHEDEFLLSFTFADYLLH